MARILVYTRTAGFRHSSIPFGVAALEELGREHGFDVTATEDPAELTSAQLARHRAVVFLSTTQEVLDGPSRAALEQYVREGGGWLGVHSAAGTEYDWPFYGELLAGARFDFHPEPQEATVLVPDREHPATAALPERWQWYDEWYNFRALPDPSARVLLAVDEGSYQGGTMGAYHPLAWSHRVDAGRACYTALGHEDAAYADPAFQEHLRGALAWAAGLE